jgi:hypothetical protein
MKYVGKAQVSGVKNFTRGRFEDAVKILAKSAALATVSSSGASFLSSRFLLRKKKCGKFLYAIKLTKMV